MRQDPDWITRVVESLRRRIGLVPQELTTDAFESVWATTTFSRRMIEAKAILQENRQLKATLQLRERTTQAVAVGRIVLGDDGRRELRVFAATTAEGSRMG